MLDMKCEFKNYLATLWLCMQGGPGPSPDGIDAAELLKTFSKEGR